MTKITKEAAKVQAITKAKEAEKPAKAKKTVEPNAEVVEILEALDGVDDLAQLKLIEAEIKAKIAAKKPKAEDLTKAYAGLQALVGTGRAKDMAKAMSAVKTPVIRAFLKANNVKLGKMKVAELKAEAMGLVERKEPKAIAA